MHEMVSRLLIRIIDLRKKIFTIYVNLIAKTIIDTNLNCKILSAWIDLRISQHNWMVLLLLIEAILLNKDVFFFIHVLRFYYTRKRKPLNSNMTNRTKSTIRSTWRKSFIVLFTGVCKLYTIFPYLFFREFCGNYSR